MIVFVKAKVTSKSNMTERRIKTRPESPTGDNRNSSDLISLELTVCVEKKIISASMTVFGINQLPKE